MKTKRLAALLLVLVILSSLSAFAGVGSGVEQYERLVDLEWLIQKYYLYGVDDYPLPEQLAVDLQKDPELYDKISGEMFERLDKYSHYLTKAQHELAYPLSNSYVGVGISMEPIDGTGIYVNSLVEGGPAETAGILPGDLIIGVNDIDLSAYKWENASEVLRGAAGTVAKMKVIRAGENKPLTFDITRKALSVPNVTYQNLGDGVGYINISRFGTIQDHSDFVSYYYDMPYEGVRSVIIDLRDNPGGDVEVVANMLNVFFSQKGLHLFQLDYADEMNNEYFTANGGRMWTPNELIVLVNENSASSSEIFAGVLMGQKAAKVIGTNTFGKARAQHHFTLDGGYVAVITTTGITIENIPDYHEVGLTPTMSVPQKTADYPMPDLTEIDASAGIYRTSSSERVLALEERLSALGFLYGEPDGIFDLYTQYAMQNFQRSNNLAVSGYASVSALKVLDKAILALANKKIYIDSQFEKAYEIALVGAKKPLSEELPKRTFDKGEVDTSTAAA